MRIALINMHKEKKGGIEKFSQKLRRFLEEKGWTVSSLQASSFHLPKTRLRKKKAFDRACARFVDKHPFDAVFSLEKTDCRATHLRLGEGIHKEYLRKRCAIEPGWKRWQLQYSRFHRSTLQIEKKVIESPHLQTLFCNSHMVKQEVLLHYQIAPEKIRVVHNSIAWSSYEKDFSSWRQNKARLLHKYSLPSCFHFLFVGHGFLRKGLFHLLRAFSQLKEEAHLSIVGSCKTKSKLESYVKKQGLHKKVRFFGAQDPMPFYQLADCLVIPSLYDPFANVTLEALAMGLNVISSKENGGSEILPSDLLLETLDDLDAFTHILQKAVAMPKTPQTSKQQREYVKCYDDQEKLTEIVENIVSL